MLKHQQERRTAAEEQSRSQGLPTSGSPAGQPVPSHSARAQQSGLARVNALEAQLSQGSLGLETASPSAPEPGTTRPASPDSQMELEADMAVVERELDEWLSKPIIKDGPALEDYDPVRKWDVCMHTLPFPSSANHNFRLTGTNSLSCIVSRWMFCQSRLLPFPVNVLSHPARKQIPTDAHACRQH